MLTVKVRRNTVLIKFNKRDSKATPVDFRTERKETVSEFMEPQVAKAITDWAAGSPASTCTPVPALKPSELELFSARERKLVIYDDAITVCGICLWTEASSIDMRTVLIRLSHKGENGYDHVAGGALMKLLNRVGSSPIARPILDFRNRATKLLAEFRSLNCDQHGIITNKRGYHLQPRIAVEVIDTPMRDAIVHESSDEMPRKTTASPPAIDTQLNERQAWILEKLRQCGSIGWMEIAQHLKCDRSTINRDLKELRTHGLILTRKEDRKYVAT